MKYAGDWAEIPEGSMIPKPAYDDSKCDRQRHIDMYNMNYEEPSSTLD